MVEQEIQKLVKERGPMTGHEIREATHEDGLTLWRACRSSRNLVVHTVGTRYLRLDRRIEGFARLSPSILREFLTYSVIGAPEDPASTLERAMQIASHIEAVSRAKLDLARHIVSATVSGLEEAVPFSDRACFILAGDIVYRMAHDVPRPERSTHKLVKGSDMDLIVIVEDDLPKKVVERLDEAIYREKHRLLMSPHMREEIDYVVKDLRRVAEQIHFDTFKRMVACKILHEGEWLYGSKKMFQVVKKMLVDSGVTERLLEMEVNAKFFREKAEAHLLSPDLSLKDENHSFLFYPTEESEEFE